MSIAPVFDCTLLVVGHVVSSKGRRVRDLVGGEGPHCRFGEVYNILTPVQGVPPSWCLNSGEEFFWKVERHGA